MRITLCLLGILLLTSPGVINSQEPGTVKCSEEALYSIEGTLTTDNSVFPVMEMQSEEYLRPGDRGEMQKYFETPFFNSVMRGWLGIGVLEVVSVKGKIVKFKVIEETSQITVNGAKKNQFAKGNRVQFAKYEYGAPVVDSTFWSNDSLKSVGTRVCGKSTGKWKYFHENGKLSEEYTLNEKGEREGTYKSYYPNGKLNEDGEYAAGKKTGEWTGRHENGYVHYIVSWKDDKMVGKYASWHDNQSHKEEGSYSWNGTPEGLWITWHPDGKIKEKGKYNYKGQMDGEWITFHENGNPESKIMYSDDIKVGTQEYFYPNGNPKETLRFNTQNQKHGTWTTWYENGKKESQVNYTSGVQSGETKTWYENGNLKDSGYYNHQGKKDGTWMYYYENGKPKEKLSYSTAQLHGECAEYYENGQLKSKGQYTFGQEDGKWEGFYENGKKKSSGEYINGKKVKTWYYWDENGKKRKEKHM